MELTYHKTLPYSTILEDGSQNGADLPISCMIFSSSRPARSIPTGTGTVMDVDAYRNVVFEPYDLVVREGYINE